jgi:hypothetical protein
VTGWNLFFAWLPAVLSFFLEVYVNISSVASAVATTPTYKQAAASTSSNPLQAVENGIENVASDISSFAAKVSSVAATVAPAIGTLGTVIDLFV